MKDKKCRLINDIAKYRNELNSSNSNKAIYNYNEYYNNKIHSLKTEISHYNNIISKCKKDIHTLTTEMLSIKIQLTNYTHIMNNSNSHSKSKHSIRSNSHK